VRLVPKSFRQRRPDHTSGWTWNLEGVTRVLYRLPELVDVEAKGRTVFVVEGEKDVDSLRDLGFVATCCAGGTNGWKHVGEHAAQILAGRHVVILPDNDKPGRQYAADVLASLRAAAKSVLVLELPGLAEKGDVSDWIRDGGTAKALQELVTEARERGPAMPELLGIDIGTIDQRLAGERERRLDDAKKLIPYDVAFLDDALGGMLPNDLVVLTARPGAGKTQLASTIAERGARSGRRVLGFFLEANRSEIERRMKYRALAQVYADGVARGAREPGTVREVISFGRWMRGELDQLFADSEPAVERYLKQQIGPRLHTVYRGTSFSLEDTERVMVAMQDRVDLVVVDHLHYVDVEDEEHEVKAQTQVMKKLRDLALRMNKPVLLVVHLKKADGMRSSLVPTMGELAGSSHITRVATHAVALAPAPHNGKDWNLAPTFMTVLKDRLDGATPLVARIVFDKTLGTYREAYELGRVSRKGNEESWEQIETLPYWAHRALRKDAQEALPL
jgi:ABC-type enterochelin transport system ATPase subunit